MEQGFSDACIALCLEQKPVARVAQTCRAAAIEMPRPTVRKWCETGYNVAYTKTLKDLRTHFISDSPKAEEVPAEVKEQPKAATEVRELEEDSRKEETGKDEGGATKKIIATIPVTLNDNNTLDLEVHEGQNVEDAVVAFCREHVTDDVSGCIRQLLPEVLEKYNAQDNMLRG